MAKKKRIDEMISFKLRMPEGVRQKVEAAAEKAERSMNSEILYRLGQTFGEEWQRFIAGVEEKEKTEKERLEQVLANPKVQKALNEIIDKHFAEHPEEYERVRRKPKGEEE